MHVHGWPEAKGRLTTTFCLVLSVQRARSRTNPHECRRLAIPLVFHSYSPPTDLVRRSIDPRHRYRGFSWPRALSSASFWPILIRVDCHLLEAAATRLCRSSWSFLQTSADPHRRSTTSSGRRSRCPTKALTGSNPCQYSCPWTFNLLRVRRKITIRRQYTTYSIK